MNLLFFGLSVFLQMNAIAGDLVRYESHQVLAEGNRWASLLVEFRSNPDWPPLLRDLKMETDHWPRVKCDYQDVRRYSYNTRFKIMYLLCRNGHVVMVELERMRILIPNYRGPHFGIGFTRTPMTSTPVSKEEFISIGDFKAWKYSRPASSDYFPLTD